MNVKQKANSEFCEFIHEFSLKQIHSFFKGNSLPFKKESIAQFCLKGNEYSSNQIEFSLRVKSDHFKAK